MKPRKGTGNRAIWRTASLTLLIVIVSGWLVACNLGAPADQPEPVIQVTTQVPVVGPQELTPEVGVQIPPTATATPELLPAEKLGPITIDGIEHRTTEPVTVRVTRGKSIGNVTCSWVLQDANRTGALGTPTSASQDENTFVDTYIFTPDQAGTYSVNCTGIATTASGQRAVSATGTPFAVEAKG